MPASKHRRKKAKRASKNPGKGKVIRPASEYSGSRQAHSDPANASDAHNPFVVTNRNRIFFGGLVAGMVMFFAVIFYRLANTL